ncbi:6918_t:CDS:10, partial [Diversispora eburnea]
MSTTSDKEIAGESYPGHSKAVKVLPPYAKIWERNNGAWSQRFLLEVEKLGTDVIEKVMCPLILKERMKGLLLMRKSRIEYGCPPARVMVKNELKDVQYLKAFWTSIIHQRNQLSVKEIFDDGSLHLVEIAGRSQIQEIENLYDLPSIKEQTKNVGEEIQDKFQPPSKRLRKDDPEKTPELEEALDQNHDEIDNEHLKFVLQFCVPDKTEAKAHNPESAKSVRNDQKHNEYITAIKAVENIQKRNEFAHNNPLWWGVLDFREENISPCPDHPRAKNFLPEGEINHLMDKLKDTIKEEKAKINKSVESFLEALSLSDIISIHHLAKECGARGVFGVRNLLQKSSEEMQDCDKRNIQDFLVNVDVEDDATIYVGKCIDDVWISRFSGKCQSERTVDMFIVGPYAKTPCTLFLYGENRSEADREDKVERSGNSRVGKACDYLYWCSSRESGIGENSGPAHKDNHDKSITNFIEIIKVAKSQHKKFKNAIIEQCGFKPLPENLQEGMKSIFIPCFQVICMKIRFYLLFQINGDLYGIWDWASELLPAKDEDIGEVVLLCRAFLIHAKLVERVGRMTNILFKRAKVFKFIPEEFSQESVKLDQQQTPQKKTNRQERET